MNKNIHVIAGPNGVGKTTFAKMFIPSMSNIYQFVNADLIAAGLSPFAPEKEAIQAGKLMLKQIDKLIGKGESFCIETTLSGRSYLFKIPQWQKVGYTVHLLFLSLPTADMALSRVAYRVKQGGHYIPDDIVKRRFESGLTNFHCHYKRIVDKWMLFDNSASSPVLLEQSTNQREGIFHGK